nr:hypothetical protein [uncultured Psychroserpens sp.]
MKNLEFLIDWYHKESNRRDSINRALNIPIGILTGLFVLFFFLFREFKFNQDSSSLLVMIFYIILALAVLMWIIVVINIFGSYNNFFKGYTYKGIPYPTELDKYHKKLEEFVKSEREVLADEVTADSLYEEQFQNMLSEYLNVNINNNDIKAAFLFRAKKYLIWCFILVIISCIPFAYNFHKFSKSENITKTEIVNIEEIKNLLNTIKENEQATEKTDSSNSSSTKADKRREQTNSSSKTDTVKTDTNSSNSSKKISD